jgi:histone H2A
LNKLFGNVTIAQGGVLPNIHPILLPKTSSKEKVEGEEKPEKPVKEKSDKPKKEKVVKEKTPKAVASQDY